MLNMTVRSTSQLLVKFTNPTCLPIAVNQIVWKHKKIQYIDDHAVPSMDWVFLRKYQTDDSSKPLMFSLHTDVNLFTLKIDLNDDFLGGGLFYHKLGTEWMTFWAVDCFITSQAQPAHLSLLSPDVAGAYQVLPRYASGQFHLHRDVSDETWNCS
jgi:hypothetical protein